MAEPGLIEDYLHALATQLPVQIVEELADGLSETYQRHLDSGLSALAAADAAVAEFGDPDTIAEAFAIASPARRTARVLLATGPLCGACWATVLLTAGVWHWPVPALARVGCCLALATIISLLVIAASTGSYRLGRHAANAACLGLLGLDTALAATVILPPLVRGWPMALAGAVALARVGFTSRALRRIHAH